MKLSPFIKSNALRQFSAVLTIIACLNWSLPLTLLGAVKATNTFQICASVDTIAPGFGGVDTCAANRFGCSGTCITSITLPQNQVCAQCYNTIFLGYYAPCTALTPSYKCLNATGIVGTCTLVGTDIYGAPVCRCVYTNTASVPLGTLTGNCTAPAF